MTFQERGRPDPEDVCFPCCIAAGFSPLRTWSPIAAGSALEGTQE